MRIATLTSVFVGLALLSAGITDAEAQQRRGEAPVPMYRVPGSAPEPERFNRQTQQLTERTFNTITSIHEDIGEENYDSAISRLNGLLERGRLNNFERALIHQNLGMIHGMTNNPQAAIREINRSLELDAMDHSTTQSMLLTLGQLYAMDEQWDQSIRALTRHFYWEDAPTADTLYLMAAVHAQKDDFRGALPWAQRAIERAREPRANWYQLLLSINNELRDYEAAANVLAQMIALWPDRPAYWDQLSGMLMELQRDGDALAVMAMAYQRGLLEDERRVMQLVRFYQYRGVPYNAARILRKGMDEGLIEGTRANWELLSQTYQASEETREAIRALQRAAALADDGELYVREAQLHAAIDDWAGVRRAVQNAVDKGGLRNPGRAWMMLGIAAFEDKNYQEALRGFRQAAQDSDTRQRANQWIQYVNNTIRTERALREGL